MLFKHPNPVCELTVQVTMLIKMILKGKAHTTGRHDMLCMSSQATHCERNSAFAALSPVGHPCYSKKTTELFLFNGRHAYAAAAMCVKGGGGRGGWGEVEGGWW